MAYKQILRFDSIVNNDDDEDDDIDIDIDIDSHFVVAREEEF
jgi:hypothetical protein